MGAAASVANAVTRGVGAHRLLGEMPPAKKLKDAMGAPVPAAGGDGDGIDVLPDDVLAQVLGFLPAEEAVRTCVLARRWRHLWKSATGIHVVAGDGQFFGAVDKFVEFVDLLMTLRKGVSLDMCHVEVGRFSALDGSCHGEDVPRHMSILFRHAVMCRVRFLRVKLL